MLYSRTLFIHSLYSSFHLLIPNSQSISLLTSLQFFFLFLDLLSLIILDFKYFFHPLYFNSDFFSFSMTNMV